MAIHKGVEEADNRIQGRIILMMCMFVPSFYRTYTCNQVSTRSIAATYGAKGWFNASTPGIGNTFFLPSHRHAKPHPWHHKHINDKNANKLNRHGKGKSVATYRQIQSDLSHNNILYMKKCARIFFNVLFRVSVVCFIVKYILLYKKRIISQKFSDKFPNNLY